MKVLQFIRDEFAGLFALAVRQWPSTSLGFRLRRAFWRRRTGVANLAMARGARIEECRFVKFGDQIEIGEGVEIIADGVDGLQVWIGSHVQFARGVYVRSSNHRFDERTRPIMDQGHVSKRVSFEGTDYAIVIEDDAWIGANAVIVSGAHVGRGAVIGAGSVVTGVIPPYAIAAGVPARVIGERKGGQP